jgi:adenosylmethionine---8-amino-7-oxononanoate aminotransferase
MDWLSKDKALIWHPFTPQKSVVEPIFIEKGLGSWLFDANGNQYLDAISSWWVNLHGHAHPYIAEKIYEQALKLEHIIFAGFTHQPAIELAEKLLPELPGKFSKVFYSDNGSTATEVAIKMALQFWWNQGFGNRKKIIAFNNGYHGDTFGAMSVSDRSIFTLAFHDLLFEVVFIDIPTEENLPELKKTIDAYGADVAAFIYEPLVQGAGGMKMYAPSLLNELLVCIKEKEIICIADEVMTGFGRTGKIFASAHLQERPDIICLSKGLTGGVMPLGVTACSQRIFDAFYQDDKLKTFFHGHSFTANPLACTAALASLHLLKQDGETSIQNLCKLNAAYYAQLKTFEKKTSRILNVRMLGTILAFEINDGENEYLNVISQTITARSLRKNVYLRPLGNTVYIMPPYCLTGTEYALLTDTINSIIGLT